MSQIVLYFLLSHYSRPEKRQQHMKHRSTQYCIQVNKTHNAECNIQYEDRQTIPEWIFPTLYSNSISSQQSNKLTFIYLFKDQSVKF